MPSNSRDQRYPSRCRFILFNFDFLTQIVTTPRSVCQTKMWSQHVSFLSRGRLSHLRVLSLRSSRRGRPIFPTERWTCSNKSDNYFIYVLHYIDVFFFFFFSNMKPRSQQITYSIYFHLNTAVFLALLADFTSGGALEHAHHGAEHQQQSGDQR